MLLHNGTIIVFFIENFTLLYKRDAMYQIYATSGSNVFMIVCCIKHSKQCAFLLKHSRTHVSKVLSDVFVSSLFCKHKVIKYSTSGRHIKNVIYIRDIVVKIMMQKRKNGRRTFSKVLKKTILPTYLNIQNNNFNLFWSIHNFCFRYKYVHANH